MKHLAGTRSQVLKGSIIEYQAIRTTLLLFNVKLGAFTSIKLILIPTTLLGGPFDTAIPRGLHKDDGGAFILDSRLEKQRRVDDTPGNASRVKYGSDGRAPALVNSRMQQFFQPCTLLGTGEDRPGNLRSRRRSVIGENRRSPAIDQSRDHILLQ